MRNKAKFLLSKSKLHEKYNETKKISDIVSYSFKTNFEIGHILEDETDSMFSIHSIESADMLKDMSRVWFIAQAWNEEELNMVFEKGITKFIIDNTMDLDKLLDYITKHDIKIELLLRIRLKEHTIHTGKYFVYGMKSDIVKKLIPKLKENSLITKLGLHFHRKTQNISEWGIKSELDSMYGEEILKKLDYVNIGGGLPAVYKNFRLETINYVIKKIEELKVWLNNMDVKMIVEPGRFIAAPPIILEAKIMNIYDNNIIVNGSVWNAAMDTFVAHIRLLIENEIDDNNHEIEGKNYTIKGNSPDSMDILRYRVKLKNPKIGDTIRFLNAGAYNFHTNFCNLPKLETIIVD
jgi:ornithine decarboxylase